MLIVNERSRSELKRDEEYHRYTRRMKNGKHFLKVDCYGWLGCVHGVNPLTCQSWTSR
jgi:hypothetical protein